MSSSIRLVHDDLRPPGPPPRRHLISIADLTRDDVERLLGTARTFESTLSRQVKKLPTLKGLLVVNLFYESSTRTSSSFELAAKRLSADTLNVKSSGSSVDKGESLKDTALTLGAYDPDVIVIRHPQIGAPQLVARVTEAHVVNAGDGKHQHPTQALLDLYTIQQQLGRLEGLHVAIVGDVLHSRVARSLVQAFALVGVKCTLVGPPALLSRGLAAEQTTDIRVTREADVLYVLRMQNERMQPGANFVPSLREYTARWGITPERLRPGQKVMHPGPMNRGVEIDARVARVARSLIQAFALVGVRCTLVGPPALLPRELAAEMTTDIDVIRDADVVYVLRMQNERMQAGANFVPSLREYTAKWGITPERLRPGQKVMHPGPMNRGVEIDPRVADSADALVEAQVRSGLVVRMAVLYDVLTGGPAGVRELAAAEVA